jgi:hypothetical protein
MVFSVLAVFCVAALGLHSFSQHAEDWRSLLAHATPALGQHRDKDDLQTDFLAPDALTLLPADRSTPPGLPPVFGILALGQFLPRMTLARPPPRSSASPTAPIDKTEP